MNGWRLVLIVCCLGFGIAVPAAAQTGNVFALGGQVTTRTPSSAATEGGTSIGLLWRFGDGATGWGWDFGFNWYATPVLEPIGGVVTDLGKLHVRPFMVGYGYTRAIGRVSVTGDAMGGLAWTTMALSAAADGAYHERFGAERVTADVGDIAVVKPETSVWVNVNRRIGVLVNAGYLVARPRVTISSTAGRDVHHVRADMFKLTVGVAYSLF